MGTIVKQLLRETKLSKEFYGGSPIDEDTGALRLAVRAMTEMELYIFLSEGYPDPRGVKSLALKNSGEDANGLLRIYKGYDGLYGLRTRNDGVDGGVREAGVNGPDAVRWE
jgi:hypothetical protein